MAETVCEQEQAGTDVLEGLVFSLQMQDLGIKPKTENLFVPLMDLPDYLRNTLKKWWELNKCIGAINVSAKTSGSESKFGYTRSSCTPDCWVDPENILNLPDHEQYPDTPRNKMMVDSVEDVVMNIEEGQDNTIENQFSLSTVSQSSMDSGFSGNSIPADILSIEKSESFLIQPSMSDVQKGKEEQGPSSRHTRKGNVKLRTVKFYRQELPKMLKKIKHPNATDDTKVRNMWAKKNRSEDYPEGVPWVNPSTNNTDERPRKPELKKMYDYFSQKLAQRSSTSFNPCSADHNIPTTEANATNKVTPAGLQLETQMPSTSFNPCSDEHNMPTSVVNNTNEVMPAGPIEPFNTGGYLRDSQAHYIVASKSDGSTHAFLIHNSLNISSNQHLMTQDVLIQPEHRPQDSYSEQTGGSDRPCEILDLELSPDAPVMSTTGVNAFTSYLSSNPLTQPTTFVDSTEDKNPLSALSDEEVTRIQSALLTEEGKKILQQMSLTEMESPSPQLRMDTETTDGAVVAKETKSNEGSGEEDMPLEFDDETTSQLLMLQESLIGHVPAIMETSVHSSPISSELCGDDQLATVMRVCDIKDLENTLNNLQAGVMT